MEEVEIWKDIPDYEGLYQVSNFGRVKSLYFGKERILKLSINKYKYLTVILHKNKKQKSFTVHRLVCLAFTPNPNNLPCINHKDENKQNNCVDNLEWCTNKYNSNYGNCRKKISDKMKGKYKRENNPLYGKHLSEETKQKMSNQRKGKPQYKHRKPILQYTLSGEFVKEWDSAKSASKGLNINGTHICSCCKGKRNKCGGFTWKYKENNTDLVIR